MLTRLAYRAAILLCVCVCISMAAPGAQAAGGIKWAKSYSAAVAEAKATDKLVMIDFYTDWCGWCKRLDKDTYTDSRVIALAGRMIPVRVNAEKEGLQAAQKYRITGFPAILFINGDSEVEGRINGYLPPASFSERMTQFVKVHQDAPVLAARLRSNPNDAETAAKLTAIYASRGSERKAVAALAVVEKADGANAKGLLSRSYASVGDMYQSNRQYDQARTHFKKALKNGKSALDTSYAHYSIAFSYLGQNRLKEGATELKAVIAVPNCPAGLKQRAQTVLPEVEKAIGQK